MKALIALCLLSTTACAGARTRLVIDSARYPVSLSNGMRGPDGRLLTQKEMEVVGKFKTTRTAWAIGHSVIPFTPKIDFSEDVNRQIEAAGGDAIVRLRTESRPCALDWFLFFTFIPIWPGCASLTIEGDIIRHRPAPL